MKNSTIITILAIFTILFGAFATATYIKIDHLTKASSQLIKVATPTVAPAPIVIPIVATAPTPAPVVKEMTKEMTKETVKAPYPSNARIIKDASRSISREDLDRAGGARFQDLKVNAMSTKTDQFFVVSAEGLLGPAKVMVVQGYRYHKRSNSWKLAVQKIFLGAGEGKWLPLETFLQNS